MNDGVMEQNGQTYWYKSETQVLADLKLGNYLEAAIIHNQQVSGVSVEELMRAKQEDKIAITDIEYQGVTSVMGAKPDTVAIFVLPPDFEEWMRRLNQRGQMDDDEKQRRLNSAVKEFKYALEADYLIFIINDDLGQAVDEIDSLMARHLVDAKQHEAGRQLIISLIDKIEKSAKKAN